MPFLFFTPALDFPSVFFIPKSAHQLLPPLDVTRSLMLKVFHIDSFLTAPPSFSVSSESARTPSNVYYNSKPFVAFVHIPRFGDQVLKLRLNFRFSLDQGPSLSFFPPPPPRPGPPPLPRKVSVPQVGDFFFFFNSLHLSLTRSP